MNSDNTEQKKISTHNILLPLIFFILGFLSFKFFFNTQQQLIQQKDLGLFWDVWQLMEEKYPFDQPSDDQKIYGAIQGLVRSYEDPYSSFFPPKKSEYFNQNISGEFGGIGVEIGVNSGFLTVISPLKDSPGERAGLLPGDIITFVDDIDVSGMTLDGAISLIRGEVGTEVTLEVLRFAQEQPLTINVIRDIVTVPIVETDSISDVFIIHLYNFNEFSEEPFRDALIEFRSSGKDKLILDLRNNPGGFLSSAIDMGSYLLDQGEVIVIEKTGPSEDDEYILRSSGYNLLDGYDFETIVLLNEGSASASEILAGALRDNGVAKIVGQQSHGKGSVQELLELSDNTSLKVTVAQWLTPARTVISEVGITPDILIEFDADLESDSQLLEAIDLFGVE